MKSRTRITTCIGLTVWITSTAPVWAAPSVEVLRTVERDQFVMAGRSGGNAWCDAIYARPDSGDEVRLTVVPGKARRDEPGLSYIVDLEERKAYLLHHADSTYTVFKYPPKTSQLERGFDRSMRKSLGSEADDFLSFRNETEVEHSQLEMASHQILERSSTIVNGMNHRFDVEAQFLPHPDLAEAAHAVEVFAGAVRNSGRPWLPLLGAATGVPLGLMSARHQPEVKIHYAERYVDHREGEIDPERFAIPEDYREVPHRPDCY